MWLEFDVKRPLKFRRPVMLVSVSTSIPQYKALYSQGRELAKHLLKKMKFEEVAVVHSSCFPPEVIVRSDGISSLLSCKVYVNRGKRDLLLFAGDSSPMDDQYEMTREVLSFAKRAGVKEIYSIGTRWAENPVPQFQDPEVNGFATDSVGVKELKKAGVKIIDGEPGPFFASMVVGLAKQYGMRGYKLQVDHGEPLPHARSLLKILDVMRQMVGLEVDSAELKAQITEPPEAPAPNTSTIYH